MLLKNSDLNFRNISSNFSIGENIKNLIDRPDGAYCFRLHRERVYYVAESTMKCAANTSHGNLTSLGVCFGKFTKGRKFMLKITALDYLAPYAKVSSFSKVVFFANKSFSV